MTLERVVARLAERVEQRYYGKYRGFVVDNKDPAQLGRLRLRVPSVLGDEVVTGWASACVLFGGAADQGFLFIPDPGAGVWVEFEEGDLEFPIWVGTFWSKPDAGTELPKPNGPDGAEASQPQDPPTCKIIKTRKGHTVQLEDADGQESVLVYNATGKLLLVMDGDGIRVTDGNRGHKVTLDDSGITVTDGKNAPNELKMDSSGITVNGPGGAVVIGQAGVSIGSSSAIEPLVLGQSLLMVLNTHTHLGNLGAPTSPPVVPFPPTVLSNNNKVQ
jgi:Type VI secretion system/phage-baseplate injector OB domain